MIGKVKLDFGLRPLWYSPLTHHISDSVFISSGFDVWSCEESQNESVDMILPCLFAINFYNWYPVLNLALSSPFIKIPAFNSY